MADSSYTQPIIQYYFSIFYLRINCEQKKQQQRPGLKFEYSLILQCIKIILEKWAMTIQLDPSHKPEFDENLLIESLRNNQKLRK